MSNEHFDIVVIGGGPGGYATALYGASAGLNIALVEKNKLGGTCLNVGCIPAKELLETAAVARTVAHAAEFGVGAQPTGLDWGQTMTRKQAIVDQLVGGLTGLLKGRKVTVFDGAGTLGGDHRTVSISGGASGEVAISGDHVVLAAGSVPRSLEGFPIDDRRIVTSDELLSIAELPASAVVIGGGAIGCEFASTMADLGSQVTILEYAPKILPGCDADVARVVERSFNKRGITIKTGVAVQSQFTGPDGVTVTYGDGEMVTAETVVMSVGRRPASDTLGLDSTAVVVDERGFIQVDPWCRTTAPGVWAIGDVVDTAQLAHVGFAEGILVVKDILGEDPVPVDYDKVPWCIYCYPEVAFAGHSEESAKEAGYDVVVSKHRFTGNGRAMIVGETEGHGQDHRREAGPLTVPAVASSACTWSGPWVTEQFGTGLYGGQLGGYGCRGSAVHSAPPHHE